MKRMTYKMSQLEGRPEPLRARRTEIPQLTLFCLSHSGNPVTKQMEETVKVLRVELRVN